MRPVACQPACNVNIISGAPTTRMPGTATITLTDTAGGHRPHLSGGGPGQPDPDRLLQRNDRDGRPGSTDGHGAWWSGAGSTLSYSSSGPAICTVDSAVR